MLFTKQVAPGFRGIDLRFEKPVGKFGMASNRWGPNGAKFVGSKLCHHENRTCMGELPSQYIGYLWEYLPFDSNSM